MIAAQPERKTMPIARLVAAVIAVLLAAAPANAAGLLAAFTVLGPDGAVAGGGVDEGACPAIDLDGMATPMAGRAVADARFPLVCDALIPPSTRGARIGDRDLPLPKATVGRIALFGDSGCRVDAQPRGNP